MDRHPDAQTRRLIVAAVLRRHVADRVRRPVPADGRASDLLVIARRLAARVPEIEERHRLLLQGYPGVSAGVERTAGGPRLVLACRVLDADGAPLGVAFTTVLPGRWPQVSVAPAEAPVPAAWRPMDAYAVDPAGSSGTHFPPSRAAAHPVGGEPMTATQPENLDHHLMMIDGARTGAASGRTYESVDPYTGEPWASVPDAGPEDVDDAVDAARAALTGPWGGLTATQRGKLLRTLGDLIGRDAERLGELETRDNGKLLREMAGQMRYLPEWFYYYAGMADKLEGSVIPSDKANYLVYTTPVPVGVVAAIVPWNSPLLLLSWKLAPALAAGCTMVVKPSDHTPVSTLALADLVAEAGFPPGVVNIVTGWGPDVGKALTAHPGVDKIAFTGSTQVGKQIAKAAADNLTRVTLELGGKSPQVIFADADLDAAANGIIAGVFAAAGQTCMAGSRVVVHRDVKDALVERLVARAETIKIGNPLDPETEMGPVATEQQYHTVLSHFASAREEGATFACGGAPVDDLGGWFVQPTVLDDATPAMRAVREEIFGPVTAVMTFDDEDEAVALANDTEFGLAGAVWTKDVHRAHRVAARLRAGTVWVNAYRVVGPQVPFGGFGASGMGRENGVETMREYTETKAVWVELTGATRDPFTLG